MHKKATASRTFLWEGFDKQGKAVKGETNGESPAVVKAELLNKGIIPKKIRKKPTSIFTMRAKKITGPEITIFARQLATMLSSGIPLVQSLDIVGRGQENPMMKDLTFTIRAEVESGAPLAEALTKHPKYFNGLFCNLVHAGEQSGTLVTMLENIADYKEKSDLLRKKIKGALTYPIVILTVAFGITACLLIFVVPQFETMFQSYGANLPLFTQIVLKQSKLFQEYWWLIFGFIGIGVWTFKFFHKRSRKFAFSVEGFLMKLPLIGKLLSRAAIARFANTLAITFASGMPLVDALKAVSGATGNMHFSKATNQIRESVSQGQQMQIALMATKLFPNMVVQMVAIGEESGTLEKMLNKVAEFYSSEIENTVDNLSKLMEPLIMVILGVLVGGLVISMYLPIFKLGSIF